MASGDTLFVLSVLGSSQPSANYATPGIISDGSTPNIKIPVALFDGGTNEHLDWVLTVPSHYAGTTGFDFKYKYAMDGVDADLVEAQFRVLKLADNDILSADLGIDTQTAVAIQDTPIATVTANKYATSPTGALAHIPWANSPRRFFRFADIIPRNRNIGQNKAKSAYFYIFANFTKFLQ